MEQPSESYQKIAILRMGGTIEMEGETLRPGEKDLQQYTSGLDAEVSLEDIVNIDSTEMTTEARQQCVERIKERYADYDGFVVTHGTDTLADTAAALSYMIEQTGKPVVVTGAQLPIDAPGSDGPANLALAIKTATKDLADVVVAFGGEVYEADKVYKDDAEGMRAFETPDAAPIGKAIARDGSLDVELRGGTRRSEAELHTYTQMDSGVVYIPQTSGSQARYMDLLAKEPSVTGVVIGGYGAGNVSSELTEGIEACTKAGKPVAVITTCRKGGAAMGTYEASSAALQAGAFSAGTLSPHAATQKMMYALGKAQDREGSERIDYVRQTMEK